jgi:hypothetical protein
MNFKILILSLISISILGMAGCFNGSDYVAPVAKTSLEKLSGQATNSEAGTINGSAKLKSDISSLFGNADDDPVPVNDGDSVQDVINRTGS